MTVQPTSRNKFNLFWDEQRVCIDCELGGSPTTSPEAAATTWGHPTRVQQITWTSPASTRVLLEAGFGTYLSHYGGPMRDDNPRDLVRVTEQAGTIPGLIYRSQDGANSHTGNHNWRASISYVTGQHNLKLGYQGAFVSWWTTPFTNTQRLAYRLNNGVPNQLTMSAGTFDTFENVQTAALYAQDQSTFGRLTLQGAVRYDRASSQFLDQHVGPDRWIPTTLTFPAQDGVTGYNDLTPRLGASYDLRGNGKTAVKVSLGKYVEAASHNAVYMGTNPLSRIATSTTRSWTDANRNFVPDCNLLNPLQQDLRASNGDFCGAMASPTFGTDVLTNTYDPDILGGWDVRPHNWSFGASVQHELLPRLSVLAAYNRRWFSNFLVTDNLAVSPADFTAFTATAPLDPRLPGGGGYPISGLYDVNPQLFGQTQNLITAASKYGGQTQYWQGVDVTINARVVRRCDGARRVQHRADGHRLVRHQGPVARDERLEPVLPRRRTVSDAGQVAWDLHRSTSGGPAERDVPERSRRAARRELQRAECRNRVVSRQKPFGRRRERDGEPRDAGNAVWRSDQSVGFPGREAPQVRANPHAAQPRPV